MRFQMITDDGTRDVDFVFGKPADLARLSRWRAPLLSGPDARVRDAREFRKLAGKRWRYYFGGDEAATRLRELKNYEKVLMLPHVTNHFFIHGETFVHCLREIPQTGLN